jgi:C1A family cysteine protease
MKRFLRFFFVAVAMASPAIAGWPQADEEVAVSHAVEVVAQEKAQPKVKHGRGRVQSKNLQALKTASHAKFGHRLKSLPKATAAQYDIRTLGICPKVIDQGQCGSCWDFSGVETCTGAFLKAGFGSVFSNDTLSPQYVLDCGQNGGCNGDDNVTVLTQCMATGLPTTAAYGPYKGGPNRCQSTTGMTLYKIASWGFCTTSNQNGVATTQDIKNAMVAYGAIGCAVAADDAFENYTAGSVFAKTTSTEIDHDVLLVGWDDTKTPPCWIMQNSWGTDWGMSGYMYIAYGVNLIGTEAVWATATPAPLPPSPPVPPPGPTPVPPLPETPMTWQINGTGTILDGVPFELAKSGNAAANAQVIQLLQSMQIGPAVPTPSEPPVTVEARLDALEKMRVDDRKAMQSMADGILKIQQILGGIK